jgi:hypothetical protein
LDDPSLDPRNGFPFLAGQPKAVFHEYLEAMGLNPDGNVMSSGEFVLTRSGVSGKKTRTVWTT